MPVDLPSGVHQPLTVNRDDNHSGLIVVITSFCLVLVLSSLGARVFSSYKRRIIQQDDYGFVAVVMIALVQTSLVLAQVHYGWGTESGDDRMLKLGYVADILLVLTLGLSKMTTAVFYLVLFKQKLRAVFWSILVGAVVWTLLSVVLLAVRGTRPWEIIRSGLFPRWQTITAIDVVLEGLLILSSGRAIYGIKITIRQKMTVFGTLSCRIILIPLSAVHLHYVHMQVNSDTPALHGAFTTVTAELYLALSVVCLVASFMKPVLAVYVDHNGIAYTDDVTPKSLSSSSRPDYNHCWQRMDPPRQSGNRIIKTVQICVSDGPVASGSR